MTEAAAPPDQARAQTAPGLALARQLNAKRGEKLRGSLLFLALTMTLLIGYVVTALAPDLARFVEANPYLELDRDSYLALTAAAVSACMIWPVALYLIATRGRQAREPFIRLRDDLTAAGDAAYPQLGRYSSGAANEVASAVNRMSADLRAKDIELESRRRKFDEEAEAKMAEIQAAYERMEASLAEAERVSVEAERASQAKSDFLAKMSHEIRTPLNGILGAIDMLVSTGLSTRQAQYAHTITASGEVLLDILNGILDLAKIEAGRIELAVAPFDPTAVVDDVSVAFGPAAHSKSLKLGAYPAMELPRVAIGDAPRIRQILVNLVGNAIKFTQQGGVTISAGWEQDGETYGRLWFDVTDTGPGIPEEARDRVFKRFEQADGSMSRKHGGAGLGLAIARDLARRMNGDVELVQSGRGGSTFRLWLTVETRQAASAPDFEGARAAVAAAPGRDRDVLAARLRRLGVAVTLTDRPAPALADDEEVDVIIAEVTPDGALEDLADALAAMRRPPALAALLAFGDDAISEDVEAEARWALLQPIREADLVRLFNELTGLGDEDDGPLPKFDLNVLVAEDNPVNIEVTGGMLENLGCKVRIAENGLAAVDAMAEESFDLILMDCQMPIMDGYEATRQIREEEAGKTRTPIIAVTANAFAEDRAACFAAGMNGFLGKPVTQAALIGEMSRFATPEYPEEAPERRRPEPPKRPARRAARRQRPAAVEAAPPRRAPQPAPAPAPALAPTGKQVIDQAALDALRKISKDGEAMVQRVVGVFLQSSPGLAEQLKAAVDAGDATAAGQHAHALKSAARNVGSAELPDMLADVEALARSGDIGGIKAAASDIDRAFGDLTLALETLKARS